MPYFSRKTQILVLTILISGQLLSCASNQSAKTDRFSAKTPSAREKSKSLDGLVSTQRSSVTPFKKKGRKFSGRTNEPESMEMVLTQSDLTPRVRKTRSGPLFTISAQDVDVKTILFSLSREIDQNILVDPSVAGLASVDLKDVTLREALDALLRPFDSP